MAATKRKMDFTNVKEGGQFRQRHREAGDYTAKIVAVDDHTSKSDNDGWVFTVTIDGDARSTYPIYCGADEKQAWKVRKLFIASGREVPKKLVLVDPNKLLNARIGVFLDDDEYEGRMRSRIEDFMPVDEVGGNGNDDADEEVEEEEEEAPPPRKRAAAKKTTRRAPEPEPEDEDEDVAEDDEDEPAPPPRKRAAAKKTTRRAAAVEDDDDLELDEL